MKKLLFVFLVGAFAACGGNGTETPVDTATATTVENATANIDSAATHMDSAASHMDSAATHMDSAAKH